MASFFFVAPSPKNEQKKKHKIRLKLSYPPTLEDKQNQLLNFRLPLGLGQNENCYELQTPHDSLFTLQQLHTFSQTLFVFWNNHSKSILYFTFVQ